MSFASFDSKRSGAPMAEINMVPLIDVMLVLLVIFIVTAPLLTQAVKLELPKASSQLNDLRPQKVDIAIDAAGTLHWNGEAVARALGFAPGEFQQQYAELVRAGIDRALESNAIAQALDKYIAERVLPLNWQGTAGQLYDLLNTYSIPDRSSWPRSPKGLSDQLRRIAPAYRAKGIDITHLGHSREGARWRIAQTRSQTNPATPPGIEGGTRYGAHRE